jgi:hypothetical protein
VCLRDLNVGGAGSKNEDLPLTQHRLRGGGGNRVDRHKNKSGPTDIIVATTTCMGAWVFLDTTVLCERGARLGALWMAPKSYNGEQQTD